MLLGRRKSGAWKAWWRRCRNRGKLRVELAGVWGMRWVGRISGVKGWLLDPVSDLEMMWTSWMREYIPYSIIGRRGANKQSKLLRFTEIFGSVMLEKSSKTMHPFSEIAWLFVDDAPTPN